MLLLMSCSKVFHFILHMILKSLLVTNCFFLLGSDGEDDRRRDRRVERRDADEEEGEKYSDEEEEDEEDIGDFIVDADGQPIHGKRKKKRAIYTDA